MSTPTQQSQGTAEGNSDVVTGRGSSSAGLLLGLMFWLFIIGLIWWRVDVNTHASVLVQIESEAPDAISGVVQHRGIPVETGRMELTVGDFDTGQNLNRYVVTISNDGSFDITLSPGLILTTNGHYYFEFCGTALEGTNTAVSYYGVSPANLWSAIKKQFAGKSRVVQVDHTTYLNCQPIYFNSFGIAILACLFVMTVLVIHLFTAPLTRLTARLLFAFTYLITLLSLVIPITAAMGVSRNAYLMSALERSPIGLVRAASDASEDPQWLLNIGGVVTRQHPAKISTANTNKDASGQGQTEVSTTNTNKVAAEREQNAADYPEIRGGITIPFYMIVLAIFGAGINLTMRVPRIQSDYDGKVETIDLSVKKVISSLAIFRSKSPTASQGRLTDLDPPTQRKLIEARKQLIENFMYLLSAPFLVIAVYSLLQAVANDVLRPVLVIMAFATGLTTDSAIAGIIKFAEERWKGPKKKEESSTEDGGAEPAAGATGVDLGAQPSDSQKTP